MNENGETEGIDFLPSVQQLFSPIILVCRHWYHNFHLGEITHPFKEEHHTFMMNIFVMTFSEF